MGLIPNYALYNLFKKYDYKMFRVKDRTISLNMGWTLGIAGGMVNNYVLNVLWVFT